MYGVVKPNLQQSEEGFSRNYSLQNDLEAINKNFDELYDNQETLQNQLGDIQSAQTLASERTENNFESLKDMITNMPSCVAASLKTEFHLLYNQVDYETDVKLYESEKKILNKVSQAIGKSIYKSPLKLKKPEHMSQYNRNQKIKLPNQQQTKSPGNENDNHASKFARHSSTSRLNSNPYRSHESHARNHQNTNHHA